MSEGLPEIATNSQTYTNLIYVWLFCCISHNKYGLLYCKRIQVLKTLKKAVNINYKFMINGRGWSQNL